MNGFDERDLRHPTFQQIPTGDPVPSTYLKSFPMSQIYNPLFYETAKMKPLRAPGSQSRDTFWERHPCGAARAEGAVQRAGSVPGEREACHEPVDPAPRDTRSTSSTLSSRLRAASRSPRRQMRRVSLDTQGRVPQRGRGSLARAGVRYQREDSGDTEQGARRASCLCAGSAARSISEGPSGCGWRCARRPSVSSGHAVSIVWGEISARVRRMGRGWRAGGGGGGQRAPGSGAATRPARAPPRPARRRRHRAACARRPRRPAPSPRCCPRRMSSAARACRATR